MTPNSIELSQYKKPLEQPKTTVKENYRWHICQTSFNMIGRICIGIIVGVCIAFSFRNEEPYDSTNVHIILCVIGVSTIFIYLNSYNKCQKKEGSDKWDINTETNGVKKSDTGNSIKHVHDSIPQNSIQ